MENRMTPEQFVYWLQGLAELSETNQTGLSVRQWQIVRDHLNLVFNKLTPDRVEEKDPNFTWTIPPTQTFPAYPTMPTYPSPNLDNGWVCSNKDFISNVDMYCAPAGETMTTVKFGGN